MEVVKKYAPKLMLFNEKKMEGFGGFLTQKIDFESQNFAIFDNVYSTERNI